MKNFLWFAGVSVLVPLLMASLAVGILGPLFKGRSASTTWKQALSSSSSSSVSQSTASSSSIKHRIVHQMKDVNVAHAKNIHLVILVHGWMGNPQELGYLHKSLERQFARIRHDHPDESILIHSAICNDGQTHDGIAAGGRRLAGEINTTIDIIRQQQQRQQQQQKQNEQQSSRSAATNDGADNSNNNNNSTISISFVGNSLGGLYARWALSELDFTETLQPRLFYTTATPHLGVSENTYVPLPRFMERVISTFLDQTGHDLFRYSDVVERLTKSPAFVDPLRAFQKRVAYANAWQTDFQVPTTTAAFLSETDSIHRKVNSNKENVIRDATNDRDDASSPFVVMVTETPQQEHNAVHADACHDDQPVMSSADCLAQRLDALGWVKIFFDVRSTLPSVPIPFSSSSSSSNGRDRIRSSSNDNNDDEVLTSRDLRRALGGRADGDGRWHAPFGHTMLVANNKNAIYRRWNAAGKPIMDRLANDVINDILFLQ